MRGRYNRLFSRGLKYAAMISSTVPLLKILV
eukprot:SAG31_NODE_36779_length_310_cov_0.966825_1_plen_30_part_10